MATPDGKRAVIYSRQSISRDPLDSLSIEFQEAECAAFVGRQGWTLVGSYSDPDRKGWRRYRPAFDAMLTRIADGGADTVVLYKLSRFARDLMMQEEVVTQIAEAGGDLVSITEPHMNTSPMIRQILGAVNENYRRDQSDWLSSTFAARSRRGMHHGQAPWGYAKVDKRLVIDDANGPLARQVWEWALAGHGTPEITYRLNERGIVTGTGKAWSPIAVRDILRNVTYAGHVRHRGEVVARDTHPGIVTDAEYETVQKMMDRRSYQRRKAAPSWAEGFIWHACGARMYLSGWHHAGVDRPRVRCKDAFARRERDYIPCRHRPASIYAAVAETRIVTAIGALEDTLLAPHAVAAALEASYGATAKQRDRKRGAIERRLADLRRQRDRLLDLVLAERIDADLYAGRDAALKTEIAETVATLEAVPPPVSLADVTAKHERLQGLIAAVRTVAAMNAAALVPLLAELEARLVIGDGDPRMEVGSAFAPYFDAPS